MIGIGDAKMENLTEYQQEVLDKMRAQIISAWERHFVDGNSESARESFKEPVSEITKSYLSEPEIPEIEVIDFGDDKWGVREKSQQGIEIDMTIEW